MTISTQLHAEWVEWVGDVSVATEYRHNLNFSAFSETAENDVLAGLSGSFGRFYQAAEQTRIGLRAFANASVYEKYDDLNEIAGGIGILGIHKFGLGNAPVLRLEISQEGIESNDRMRDGSRFTSGLRLSKRFTDRFDANMGVTKSIRHGHDGKSVIAGLDTNVFDQVQTTWSLRGNFLLTERILLSGQYARLTGEFDAQCPEKALGPGGGPSGLGKNSEPAIEAAATDTVFGGACTYRLDGNVNLYNVDFSYFLTPSASLDIGYAFRDGSAGSLDYNSPSLRVGLSWIF